MNVFELGWIASPIIGAAVGVQRHVTLGVGSVLGGLIGAAIGLAVYFVLILGLGAILCLVTGKPFFRPKK
jgi:hypothetical protein